MFRKLAFALAILVALALLLGVVAFFWLRGAGRAQREGFATLPALAGDIEVRWDRWGVPHLKGSRGVDLAAAMGWIHANDRYLQMELGRLRVKGRLAGLFGERALDLDRESRTLRFHEAAEALWESAGAESRRWLTSYSAGVNSRMFDRAGDLPPTLTVLRGQPERWSPIDSLGIAVLMGRDLSFWQGRPEEIRFEWLGRLGAERTAELIGVEELHVAPEVLELARDRAGERGAEGLWSARRAGPLGGASATFGGSNSWVLGASHSAGAAPLVANDPHLRLRLPPVWYQAHLRSEDYEAAGMTLPGLPAIVIGHGPRVAWAFTNVMLDDHDLFLERFDETGKRVRRGEGWVEVERQTERLAVRGAEPVEIELARTDIGPLLPAEPERGLPARSLAWAMYEPADPLSAFLHLARAAGVDEVAEGIGGYVAPAQNLLAADRAGGILFTVLGRLPKRRAGDGRVPAPGWDPAYGWEGVLPHAASPRVENPADDRWVTANHDLRPAGHDWSADFDLAARAERIQRLLLETGEGWSPSAVASVQTDVRYSYAAELVERLASEPLDGVAERAAAVLRGWDGEMEVRGPSALFALFERELVRAALGDEVDLDRISVKDDYTWARGLLLGELSVAWFDDVTTPAVESRAEIVAAALESAWEEGRRLWGNEDVRTWSWGELHTLELRHPLGALPLLDRLANRGPFPLAGSGVTVNAFGGRWRGDARPVTYGPSMRWITDLGDPDRTLAVLPGGQAGHPFDSHYDDQLPLYLAGRLHPVQWSEETIRRATVSTLWLER